MDNVREWHKGTSEWTSVAVASNGEYGVEKGLFFSYPVTFSRQQWKVVPGILFIFVMKHLFFFLSLALFIFMSLIPYYDSHSV
jgi:hypothetical protein